MRIRSITILINPGWPLDQALLNRAGALLASSRQEFAIAGYEVQSTRLATTPFPNLLQKPDQYELNQLVAELQNSAAKQGIEYFALGPAMPDEEEYYRLIPAALALSPNTFFSGLMTTSDGGISLRAVRRCAEIIHAASTIEATGFANLRFTALAFVPPEGPFFPAAYASNNPPSFALALEAADLAVQAAANCSSFAELRSSLIEAIENNTSRLAGICEKLSSQHHFRFAGMDFSLAPFPTNELSLGAALELIGVPATGLHGTVTAAACFAEALDRARFPRTGFNGLFTPVLEDSILAQRASEGNLWIKDLLLMSTICGTGLDTLPLPGNLNVEQIFAILIDLAAVASRHNKPLTARLMPIPGKTSGDPVEFDFAFFAPSRVMQVQAEALEGLFQSDETIYINPRV